MGLFYISPSLPLSQLLFILNLFLRSRLERRSLSFFPFFLLPLSCFFLPHSSISPLFFNFCLLHCIFCYFPTYSHTQTTVLLAFMHEQLVLYVQFLRFFGNLCLKHTLNE